VSETLLFRYYGSKTALFDEVVSAPFVDAIRAELADWEQAAGTDERRQRKHHIFVSIYELFEKNRALLLALLSARGRDADEMGPLPFGGFLSFYNEVTRQQLASYAQLGQEPTMDVALGVRLGFGMLAASVLFNDWLFPDGRPPREVIVDTLEQMVSRALDPQDR